MQILITDKKNFVVENDGVYGFFDKTGKFLRLSDGKEWNWSAKCMRVVVDNVPSFDLKAMAEAKPVVVEEVIRNNNNLNRTFTFADLIKAGNQKNKKANAF